jgi:hypothetical protein
MGRVLQCCGGGQGSISRRCLSIGQYLFAAGLYDAPSAAAGYLLHASRDRRPPLSPS